MSSAFSDSFIRNIKTIGRYTDAAIQGLNLQVKANGGKYWALRYLFQDKRYDLSLGSVSGWPRHLDRCADSGFRLPAMG